MRRLSAALLGVQRRGGNDRPCPGVLALYGIDRTGETVNVRGTMSRATTTAIPKDDFSGRSARAVTGLPYPVSVTRAP